MIMTRRCYPGTVSKVMVGGCPASALPLEVRSLRFLTALVGTLQAGQQVTNCSVGGIPTTCRTTPEQWDLKLDRLYCYVSQRM